jgi:5-methylcytosine-specific restriction endonuclease McrA
MPTERASKLDRLSADERGELVARLHAAQNQVCYVCHEVINPQVHEIDIDHIIALARLGPDEESNAGLTHANCNRSKGTRGPQLQRLLHEFRTYLLKYTAGNAHGRDRNFTLNKALTELRPHRQEAGVVTQKSTA